MMALPQGSDAVYFNPRPPRGGRRDWIILSTSACLFQSTPPARGATLRCPKAFSNRQISIHAPREGGDPHAIASYFGYLVFQSTPPARGATYDAR